MDFYSPEKGLTTYETGIVQAKAYRVLRKTISSALKKYNLTMSEWAILGSVYNKKKAKYSSLADLLEVKAPLITKLVDALIKKNLLESIQDEEDKRSKFLTVTKKANQLVPTIEKEVKTELNLLRKDITHSELLVYVKVLHVLASQLQNKDT